MNRNLKPAMLVLGLPIGVAIGAAILTACTAHDLQTPSPLPEKMTQIFRDVNPVRDLDILFVIDNSGSMKEEQDNLKKNFPAFVNELRAIPGGLPNVHMAVVSSDVGAGSTEITGNPACNRPGGDRGVFQGKTKSCGLNSDASFIISLNNGDKNQDNFDNARSLEEVFGCIAELGTLGCGFEHQLQAMRVALAPDFTPQNAGFLRPNAFLAIVLITDEDDCSGEPDSDLYTDMNFMNQQASLRCSIVGHQCNGVDVPNGMDFTSTLGACKAHPNPRRLIPIKEFVDYVYGLKAKSPQKIVVSAITGWPGNPDAAATTPYRIKASDVMGNSLLDIEPACVSANGSAAPALRVKEFVDSFGDNGIVESICSGDFAPALKRIGNLIAVNLTPGCIEDKLIDSDRNLDNGFQGECRVTNSVPDKVSGDFKNVDIPKCDANASNKPCYNLVEGGAAGNTCPMNRWVINVVREGEAPPDTQEAISCRTCADIGGESTKFCK